MFIGGGTVEALVAVNQLRVGERLPPFIKNCSKEN